MMPNCVYRTFVYAYTNNASAPSSPAKTPEESASKAMETAQPWVSYQSESAKLVHYPSANSPTERCSFRYTLLYTLKPIAGLRTTPGRELDRRIVPYFGVEQGQIVVIG